MKLNQDEKELLFDMFEYYLQHKLEGDDSKLSVFTNLAEETGDMSPVGDLYVKSKHLYDLKHKLREHIQYKKGKVKELRNKLYDLLNL